MGTGKGERKKCLLLKMQQVNIIGMGYVGFPCAVLVADAGHTVNGVDINRQTLKTLEQGLAPFPEDGLQELFDSVRKRGLLTTSPVPSEADVHIVAVPTPITLDNEPDLSFVRTACLSLAPVLRKGDVVLVESTISPGAIHECVVPALNKSGFLAGKDFGVAYCPERVLPGAALKEMVFNDRVVGGIDASSCQKAKAFYQTFVKGVVHTASARQAEMIKLVENAYRDVNIAFANEIHSLCRLEGIDSLPVIELANLHPRVNILQPGPGVGGHCIPVDPWFLVHRSKGAARLLKAARDVNDSRPGRVLDEVKEILGECKSSKVCLLGVTYKPNVSDVRESPALRILQSLREEGYNVCACDPYADVDGLSGLEDAVTDSDLLLPLVRHDKFLNKERGWYEARMRKPRIHDVGGFWPDVEGKPFLALAGVTG